MCAAVSGSTCETWLKTRMQPPVAGIFSPSIQVRFVVANKAGLSTGTARLNAHPRFCWSGRTGRNVTMVPPAVALERFLRRPGTNAGVRVRLLGRVASFSALVSDFEGLRWQGARVSGRELRPSVPTDRTTAV